MLVLVAKLVPWYQRLKQIAFWQQVNQHIDDQLTLCLRCQFLFIGQYNFVQARNGAPFKLGRGHSACSKEGTW